MKWYIIPTHLKFIVFRMPPHIHSNIVLTLPSVSITHTLASVLASMLVAALMLMDSKLRLLLAESSRLRIVCFLLSNDWKKFNFICSFQAYSVKNKHTKANRRIKRLKCWTWNVAGDFHWPSAQVSACKNPSESLGKKGRWHFLISKLHSSLFQ